MVQPLAKGSFELMDRYANVPLAVSFTSSVIMQCYLLALPIQLLIADIVYLAECVYMSSMDQIMDRF